MATTRARRQAAELQADVDRVRAENDQLRETAKRLVEDPTAIELVAREKLGLIREGEILVIVKDAKPPTK